MCLDSNRVAYFGCGKLFEHVFSTRAFAGPLSSANVLTQRDYTAFSQRRPPKFFKRSERNPYHRGTAPTSKA
jgi:hypothetical protein